MRRVYVESPYGSDNPEIIQRNIVYVRACLRDCILRGEAPFASHLLYTQDGVLRDEVPEERTLGMEAGFAPSPENGMTPCVSAKYTQVRWVDISRDIFRNSIGRKTLCHFSVRGLHGGVR